MTWPMVALGFMLSILQRGQVSYRRLKEIFDAKPEVEIELTGGKTLTAGDFRF